MSQHKLLEIENFPEAKQLPETEKEDLQQFRESCLAIINERSSNNNNPIKRIIDGLDRFTNKKDKCNVIRRSITGFLRYTQSLILIDISKMSKFLDKPKSKIKNCLRAIGYIQDKSLSKYNEEYSGLLEKISQSKDITSLRNWTFFSHRIEDSLLQYYCFKYHISFKAKIVDFIGYIKSFLPSCNDRQLFALQIFEYIEEGDVEIQQIVEILKSRYIPDNLLNNFFNACSIASHAKMLKCATFFSQMEFANAAKQINDEFSNMWRNLVEVAMNYNANFLPIDTPKTQKSVLQIQPPNSKQNLPIPQINGYSVLDLHQDEAMVRSSILHLDLEDNEPLTLPSGLDYEDPNGFFLDDSNNEIGDFEAYCPMLGTEDTSNFNNLNITGFDKLD